MTNFNERWNGLVVLHGSLDHSEVKPARGGAGALITLRDPDNVQLEVFSSGE